MKYLSTSEAAKKLGLSRNFLERRRMAGEGPPYIRVTPRCVRYAESDLDEWMAAHAVSGEAAA